jgi:Ni,Fe-hydrogenase III component G
MNITEENQHLLKVGTSIIGKNFPEQTKEANWNNVKGIIRQKERNAVTVEFFPTKKEQENIGHDCDGLLNNKNGYYFFYSYKSWPSIDSIYNNLEFLPMLSMIHFLKL